MQKRMAFEMRKRFSNQQLLDSCVSTLSTNLIKVLLLQRQGKSALDSVCLV